MSNSSFVYDVNGSDFENRVIKASFERPVAVDFWAPWCGPCRALGPILEGVIESFGGEIWLAKLNTEIEPELASTHGVRGIPNVKIFKDGEVVDEFTGLVPEFQIRSLFQKYIVTELDLFFRNLRGDREDLASYEGVASKYENSDRFCFEFGRALFLFGQMEKAKIWLSRVPPLSEYSDRAQEIILLSDLRNWEKAPPSDKYQTYLQQAAIALARQDYEGSFNQMIELLMRKKEYLDGNAKKMAVALLQYCPEGEKRTSCQRRLSMVINS